METQIHAPGRVCFDLARDVGVHAQSLASTGERVVGGVTTGLLELGDEVTFEARHFGLRWRLTARVTRLEPPSAFVDEQVRGPFRRITHAHEFHQAGGGTLMVDRFEYVAPLGPLGRLADAVFLKRYMRHLLEARARFLKELAERSEVPTTAA